MPSVDLARVIKDILLEFSEKRANEIPPIRATIAPRLPFLQWCDNSLQRFLRDIIYELLRANQRTFPVRVSNACSCL